ncbi:hypothetical protein HY68_16295 [Streptomyces sp. AcH 505]|uniref:hypothetical protein n=1 Tax=Streptomyces sp. AcH 505 TaxID=352211 RepID=UPI000591DB32|nr:hypothetical protein HY68_16295 [Streptomyces sp. AcH 505]
MTWSGHWHGYGPWTGSRNAYGQEPLRRPGLEANSEQTRMFLASVLPPLMTGHWLMRRDQTAADRTWTTDGDAIGWLQATYEVNPPFERDDGGLAYIALEDKIAYATDSLHRGVDVCWVHYTKSSSLVSFSVVACPNHHHPHISCPLPPT